jgi:hypothetical protein
VIGDHEDYDPTPILAMFHDVDEVFLWGGDYFAKHLPPGGSWLVWDKREGIEGVEYSSSSFELCWSKEQHRRDIIRARWFGLCGMEREDTAKRVHPTQKPAGVITWIIEHHVPLMMRLCDRLAVLNFGRRIALGSPEHVRHDPAVIEAYLGGQASAAGERR